MCLDCLHSYDLLEFPPRRPGPHPHLGRVQQEPLTLVCSLRSACDLVFVTSRVSLILLKAVLMREEHVAHSGAENVVHCQQRGMCVAWPAWRLSNT
jgi:hypothetical protein